MPETEPCRAESLRKTGERQHVPYSLLRYSTRAHGLLKAVRTCPHFSQPQAHLSGRVQSRGQICFFLCMQAAQVYATRRRCRESISMRLVPIMGAVPIRTLEREGGSAMSLCARSKPRRIKGQRGKLTGIPRLACGRLWFVGDDEPRSFDPSGCFFMMLLLLPLPRTANPTTDTTGSTD